MRNLKKVLSLALAMVMLLGMMVVGAGATSFTDDEQIENQEAVDVVSGIGILTGIGDGSFNPQGTLSRAEAAVVIAKLDLGAAFGNLETTNAATFSDVGIHHWAKPYIDYCAARGLIAGVGGGRFNPDADVSGIEFGLMVSRVLGYEDDNEGIGGADWAVQAAALARKAGLTINVTLAHPEAISRDDMAQVTYNALTADVVEYDGRAITIGDVTIPAGKAAPKQHNINSNYAHYIINANNTTDPNIQLCEEKFPALKLNKGQVDAFARPVNVWVERQANGTVKTLNTNVQNVALTYTDSVSKSKIYSDLGLSATAADVDYFIDGRPTNYGGTDGDGAIDIARSSTQYVGGPGVLTQVFTDNNGYPVKVVLINTYVARVSAVSSANETTTITQLGQNDVNNIKLPTLNSRTVSKTGYSVGDIVSYTIAWNGTNYSVQDMKVLTDPVSGTLTKWTGNNVINAEKGTSNSNFTLDSNDPYRYSLKSVIHDNDGQNTLISGFTANKSELNVYLDEYDFALYVAGVEAEKNYAAVIGIGATNAYGSESKGVTLLLPDNTTVEVTAKLVSGLNWTAFSGTSNGGNTRVDWDETSSVKNLVTDGIADVVTYTVDDKGVYTLSLVAHPDTTITVPTGRYVDVTAGTPAVTFVNGRSLLTIASSNFYTTSKTIFMVCTGSGTNRSYSVYTGYANAPSILAANHINGIAYGLNRTYRNQIDVVYIDATQMANTVASNIYFVKPQSPTVNSDVTGQYLVLPAVVDGEVTEIMIRGELVKDWNYSGTATSSETLVSASANLYTIKNVVRNDNNIITDCELVTPSDAFNATRGRQTGTINPGGDVLGWNSGAAYVAYNNSTKAYRVDEDYTKIESIEVNGIPTDNDDFIYAADDGAANNNKKLTTVFVVDRNVTSGTPSGPSTGKPSDDAPSGSTVLGGGTTLTVARLQGLLDNGMDVIVNSNWTATGTVTVPAGRTLTFKGNATFTAVNHLVVDPQGTALVDGKLTIANDIPDGATVHADAIDVTGSCEFVGTVDVDHALTVAASQILTVTGTVTAGSVTGNTSGTIIVLSTDSLHVSGTVSAITIQVGDGTAANNGRVVIATLASNSTLDVQNVGTVANNTVTEVNSATATVTVTSGDIAVTTLTDGTVTANGGDVTVTTANGGTVAVSDAASTATVGTINKDAALNVTDGEAKITEKLDTANVDVTDGKTLTLAAGTTIGENSNVQVGDKPVTGEIKNEVTITDEVTSGNPVIVPDDDVTTTSKDVFANQPTGADLTTALGAMSPLQTLLSPTTATFTALDGDGSARGQEAGIVKLTGKVTPVTEMTTDQMSAYTGGDITAWDDFIAPKGASAPGGYGLKNGDNLKTFGFVSVTMEGGDNIVFMVVKDYDSNSSGWRYLTRTEAGDLFTWTDRSQNFALGGDAFYKVDVTGLT